MNPLQKLRLVVARGVVNLVKYAGLQEMQVNLLEGETRDEVERVQNFGHSGNPPAGSTVVAVAVGGSRDHMIVVGCEHPDYSPSLQSGESAMYAQFGQLLKMDKDGNVILKCKSLRIESDGDVSLSATGGIEQKAKGALSISAQGGSNIRGGLGADKIDGEVISSKGVVLETHTHTGVAPGGDKTGVPVK
ncbi:phage baseplate assembly protein V [Snodgrassella alvi]|uniref:phage baseplate assembly protein V n=1 Tax=Snodgrassella alvi TaxID=1196083 RepID=UPI003513F5AD